MKNLLFKLKCMFVLNLEKMSHNDMQKKTGSFSFLFGFCHIQNKLRFVKNVHKEFWPY